MSVQGVRQQNFQILKENKYTISSGTGQTEVNLFWTMNHAIKDTEFIHENSPIKIQGPFNPRYEVTSEGTIESLRRLIVTEKAGPTVAVISASPATVPDGSILKSQDQAVARASGYYQCLVQHQQFYQQSSPFYSDSIVFSSGVPIFRDSNDQIIPFFEAAFISVVAPKNKSDDRNWYFLYQRISKIIRCAISNNQENIVLCAFGCGHFHQRPIEVAQSFKRVLVDEGLGTFFKRITFAIPSNDAFKSFQTVFQSC